ncbi:hypothetical protein ACJX0J_019361, partial [Zea mays]
MYINRLLERDKRVSWLSTMRKWALSHFYIGFGFANWIRGDGMETGVLRYTPLLVEIFEYQRVNTVVILDDGGCHLIQLLY